MDVFTNVFLALVNCQHQRRADRIAEQGKQSIHNSVFLFCESFVPYSVCMLWVGGCVVVVDRFYIAAFSDLEHTHCARMRFYMSDYLFMARF